MNELSHRNDDVQSELYNKCNNLCLNYTGELQDTDDRTISSDDTEDEVGCNYETESM